MANPSHRPWQIWSNVLSFSGAAGCLVVFLWSFGLIGFYSSKRPREPMPERGWIEQLHWTHGYYGTHAENEQLLRLHDLFFPFILVAGGGHG
jgi:hypothetical protein